MELRDIWKKYREVCDYADLRVSENEFEKIIIENGRISSISRYSISGYGVRIILNGSLGFGFTSNKNSVEEAFKNALKLARISEKLKKEKIQIPEQDYIREELVLKTKEDPFEVDEDSKLKFLIDFDDLRKNEIKNVVSALFFERKKEKFIGDREISQEITRTIFSLRAVGKERDKMVTARISIGRNGGYENIKEINKVEKKNEIKEKINNLLKAKHPKPGIYPVVIDNELTVTFFHEAIGHSCEADSILSNTSTFCNKIGKKIGSELITLYDDPTLYDRGFYFYDNEGIKGKRTTLIENGVLVGLMHSRETAAKMNTVPSGNGRAECATEIILPRMSNTVVKKGDLSFDELIEDIKFGYYIKGGGGTVDTITGNFMFKGEIGYEIVNGKLGEPVLDVSLSGTALEILNEIDGVGKDWKISYKGSSCGKDGQWVDVGGAAPHIRIKKVMVGGRHS